MAKKRTKKQKETARRPFEINWTSTVKSGSNKANVNRQFVSKIDSASSYHNNLKITQNSAKETNIVKIKKNMLTTLIIATLILASEIVLYFFLK